MTSMRVSATSLIANALVVGDDGLGVEGVDIPSTGTNGAAVLHQFVTLPADDEVEFRMLVTSQPSVGTLTTFEDSSFIYDAPVPTTDSFNYEWFRDGVSQGADSVDLIIGPADAAFGCTITVASGKMPSSQTGFNWLAIASNFPTAAIDGGASSILNGGGNLRCYVDNTKTVRLPIDVVEFVTGVSPSIQLWGLSPALDVGSTVYIEADTTETTQPLVAEPFGRDAVWVDYAYVEHFSSTSSVVDSTGNGASSLSGTFTLDAAPTGSGVSFSTTQLVTTPENAAIVAITGDRTVQTWLKCSSSVPQVVSEKGVNDGAFIFVHQNGEVRTAAATDGSLTDPEIAKTPNGRDDGVYRLYHAYYDGANKVTENAILIDTSVSFAVAVPPTTPLFIGSRAGSFGFTGSMAEFRIRAGLLSSDHMVSESNNQSDPSTFWDTSAWSDGAVIDVAATLGLIDYSSNNTTVQLSSEIDVTATLGAISYSSQNTTVQLSGVVDVTATLGAITYTSQDTMVQLSGEIDVIATLGAINYTSQNTTVQVSGAVNINAGLGTINYSSLDTVVQLSGEIILNATLGQITYSSNDVVVGLTSGIAFNATLGAIDYSSQNATVMLQGEIVIPVTLGQISYDSNNVIVNIGGGQIIGVVTSGFADDIYSAGFKPDQITVNFKT